MAYGTGMLGTTRVGGAQQELAAGVTQPGIAAAE